MLLPIPVFGICGDFMLILMIYLCFSSSYILAFRSCFLGSVFPVVVRDFYIFVEDLIQCICPVAGVLKSKKHKLAVLRTGNTAFRIWEGGFFNGTLTCLYVNPLHDIHHG